ncbi:MAG: ribonuclease HII [Treponema sp.]|jgi:ribonuclease HII|nr:ribonuclease HII [Treponema sp.]
MLCGIDEAGRGPLAGPVCAAAVVLPDDFPTGILDDSKKLKPKQREDARRVIVTQAVAWAVAWAGHAEIDAVNILQASLLAMRRAFEYLLVSPPEGAQQWPEKLETEVPFGKPFAPAAIPPGLSAVADGLHIPVLPIPCTPVVKADASVREVMAASILAKTARDQLMEHYGGLYPQYGYERHKGYPTREHRALVRQYGPSPIQRKSFRIN